MEGSEEGRKKEEEEEGMEGEGEKRKGNLCHHIKGKKDYFHRPLNFIRTRLK